MSDIKVGKDRLEEKAIENNMDRVMERELEIEEDMAALEQELVYESDVSMVSNIPKFGKWYMFLTTEANRKSRYYISPMNRSSTFDFRIRQVITSVGMAEGRACSIVAKRVGEAPDIRTGKIVGIYQILNTPSFARAGIKVQELRDALKKDEIEKLVKIHTYNVALRLKGLLYRQHIINASLGKELDDMEVDIVKAGAEIATKALSFERAGADSQSKQLRKKGQIDIMKYLSDKWDSMGRVGQGILILVVAAVAFWWLFTPH